MKKLLYALFLLPSLLFCEIFFTPFLKHDIKHHHTAHQSDSPHFKGLILIGNREDLNPSGYENVQGVMSYNATYPGSIVALKKRVRPYFERSLDHHTIMEIKDAVFAYYQDHNQPAVTITIPKQDISDGVLQLVVTEQKLGQVTCKGNTYFSSERIESAIKLEPGETIASDVLNQNLYWLNRNPFREVNAVYVPGKDGQTDIELLCKDRFPLRLYLGIDNTGNDVTGNNRLYSGVDIGNLFWSDQRLSYQFITSSDFKKLRAHTLYYELPLPWQHMLNIYGGYSRVDAEFSSFGLEEDQFRTHGFSVQASMRYDIPLKPKRHLLHEVIWGFDFKRTNNNLSLGGIPVISEDNVNLTQAMMGYNLGYEIKALTFSWEIEGFYSPGSWISDQTNEDYESLRPYAKNQYVYLRTALAASWRFYNQWTLSNIFRGQLASVNLLPSEEYGVGGYNTVRGYKERLVNGDNVFIWNLELQTPTFSILNPLAGWKKFRDSMQFLVFFDYGLCGVNKTAPMQEKTEYLMSIGPGVRYTVIPYVSFRADWGFQLHNLHLGDPNRRLDFALTVGY